MKKVIYIHGLGGSGNGSSAQNVKKLLGSKYEFSAGTYDLLKPAEAFEQIKKDVKGTDIVIASSLGAFYASAVICPQVMLLLNPCLKPEYTIKHILYPEQRKDFDEEKCRHEWLEIKKNWDELDQEEKGERFGVFAKNDELFSFYETFKVHFGTFWGARANSAFIEGTHEIAKDEAALKKSLDLFWKYLDKTSEPMGKGLSASFDTLL